MKRAMSDRFFSLPIANQMKVLSPEWRRYWKIILFLSKWIAFITTVQNFLNHNFFLCSVEFSTLSSLSRFFEFGGGKLWSVKSRVHYIGVCCIESPLYLTWSHKASTEKLDEPKFSLIVANSLCQKYTLNNKKFAKNGLKRKNSGCVEGRNFLVARQQ